MEKAFIESVNRGDKKAFRLVFDKYYNALCAFTYKYIPDQSEIEDIVQDVFVSFWEHNKDFEHLNSIKAFLFTSTRNKCLNYLKHKLVKQKHESAIIYELESNHFFTRHVIEEDTFNQLYQEINKLPSSAQKIMLLALKGLKNREIAIKLSISENTVKTQKKIAYAKIKENISPSLKGFLLSL
jgi:RNA polymerase sigma-70 factor (ECF subfamily)